MTSLPAVKNPAKAEVLFNREAGQPSDLAFVCHSREGGNPATWLLFVIPAKAEVLFNSEAGQPSDLAFVCHSREGGNPATWLSKQFLLA